MTITLNRAQRRQMQKLADRVDRVTQGDRRFFERFPSRQHRVRLAAQCEIEQFGLIAGIEDTRAPAGFEHFIVVKNISPGVRFRRPLTSTAGNDTDVSETEAKWLYESTLSDRDRELEAQLRAAAEKRQ